MVFSFNKIDKEWIFYLIKLPVNDARKSMGVPEKRMSPERW